MRRFTHGVALPEKRVIEEEAESVAIRTAGDLRPAYSSSGEGAANALDGVVVEREVLGLRAVPVGDVGFVPHLSFELSFGSSISSEGQGVPQTDQQHLSPNTNS